MTPDQKLQTLFAEAAPPNRDYAFEAEVARRIARRRAVFSVAAMTPWAIVSACALWGVRPLLPSLGDGLAAVNPIAAALVGALALVAGAGAVTRRLEGRG
jgi:uncharacterized membrane protein